MKKFFIKAGMRGLFSFNEETEDFNVEDYMHTGIDWAYVVPEDGVLTINDDTKVEQKVEKGDVVIQFYKRPYRQHNVIVVKSKEWKANILSAQKYEEEMRAKQADAKCSDSCCECACEDCANC